MQRPPTSGTWTAGDPRARTAALRYPGLDEYIKKHVGRVPTRTTDLHAAVEADYGEVHPRTFARALVKLRRTGEIIGAPEPGLSSHPREMFYRSAE